GWLAQLLGMPPETEGVLQSGGSLANLTAFLVARQETGAGERGVAYLTDQSHASLVRNLQHMGLPERQVRILPSDPDYRMDVEALTQAIHEDRAAGLVPMLVVASAGTTNTGAVDPLPVLASLCERESIWFHVDGAYGAPAALTPAGRAYLAGLARADSLVLDPHKWLFQPYDAGLCLIRRPGALERCFAMYPEYLRDAQGRQQSVASFGNRSLELSRRSRALKLWLSLRTYGVARFRTAIQRGIERAEQAEALLRAQPDVWEVVSPARIGIVCFALRGAAEGEHARRAQALAESGFACLSSTRLKGREVLRLCTINPLTTADDLRETLVRLAGEL
ncbi:MAG TPA: aminotransferase class I/II-fold pyridoxal phosphate-dependent enzyme, partial [Thiolinea sp.]|nr:aminotransferase class I/II-fold pyridoxal phosphate-dependent enzyme [Thiolinea sp.]